MSANDVGFGARVSTEQVGESLKTTLARWRFNLFPAYRRTGGRIRYIAADWSEVRVRLPLTRRTRNYVGTIFGGSMFAAVDPVYMVMLIHRLGRGYIVWDKSASIRFHRPGRDTLYATFRVGDEEVAGIQDALAEAPSLDRLYEVELVDRHGELHARVEKTIHIQLRTP